MKILLMITGLGMGGAECQVVNLADKFSAAGHDVLLIALTGDVIVRPTNPKVYVECIGMNKTIFGFIRAYRRIRMLICNFGPDVIHSHMVHANIFSRLLRLTVFIPRLICTSHSTYEGGYMRMLAYRLTDHLANISTNVSVDAVNMSIKRRASVPGKIIPVYNGIDSDRFMFNLDLRKKKRSELGIEDNKILLLAVGRLSEAKDYPNLLAAFAEVAKTNANVLLNIVGIGHLEATLKKMTTDLGIYERVKFCGLQHDIPAFMSAADIFVLSSAWEGFGLVVAEAMACERVVVATNCGGIREVVGYSDFLVPPRDPKKLAQAINHAINLSSEMKARHGLYSRQRILSHYSLDAVVSRWLKIYQGDYRASVTPLSVD